MKQLLQDLQQEPLGELFLVGAVPSAKNSRILTKGRSFPSRAVRRKFPTYIKSLAEQWGAKPLRRPLLIYVEVYCQRDSWTICWRENRIIDKDKEIGCDVDNKLNSAFDVLKKAGVVADDCLFLTAVVTKFPGQKLECGDYGARILLFPTELR